MAYVYIKCEGDAHEKIMQLLLDIDDGTVKECISCLKREDFIAAMTQELKRLK